MPAPRDGDDMLIPFDNNYHYSDLDSHPCPPVRPVLPEETVFLRREATGGTGRTGVSVSSGVTGGTGTTGGHDTRIPEHLCRFMFGIARKYKAKDRYPNDSEAHEIFDSMVLTVTFEEFQLILEEMIDKVTFQAGKGPLEEALRLAETRSVPKWAERYDTHKFVLLAQLCAVLQKKHGKEPFFLASDEAAEVLGGLSYRTVCRWMRLLCRHGVIELVERGHTGRASTYRYLKG